MRGQDVIDNGFSTRFVTHVHQRRDDSKLRRGFKDKVYHVDTQLLYQNGHEVVTGVKVLKTKSTTFVTHQRPPHYSLLPDSYDPRREVRLSNEPSVTSFLSLLVKQRLNPPLSSEVHRRRFSSHPGFSFWGHWWCRGYWSVILSTTTTTS